MTDYEKKKQEELEQFNSTLRAIAYELNEATETKFIPSKHGMTSGSLLCVSDNGQNIDLFCVCWPSCSRPLTDERLEVSIDRMFASDGEQFTDSSRISLTVSMKRSPKAIANDLRRRAINDSAWHEAQGALINRVLRANKTLADEESMRSRLLERVEGCEVSPNDPTRVYIKGIGASIQINNSSVHLNHLTLIDDDAVQVLALIVKLKRERDEREAQNEDDQD